MIEELDRAVKEADKVLIGIGLDFQERFEGLNNTFFEQLQKEEPLLAGYEKIKYMRENKDQQIEEAYKKLYSLVKNKDYFLVSLCTDDRIFETEFSADKIVTPCGGFRNLQCSDNCTEELLPVTEQMILNREKVVCPHCRKATCFNQITAENYNENGYLLAWEEYRKWLQSTINKKLCVIELGVNMKYPSVIRFAFEKVVFYNKKAVLYRINKNLYQLTKEISEKGISIKEDPVIFLNNM